MRVKLTGLWRHSEFVKLWTGQTISQFGSQITVLALPLTAVLTLKANAFEMGILGAAEFVPFLLVGLFAGVWVDRMRRRPVLILADVGRTLLLGSIPLAALFGVLRMEQLYVVAFLVGIMTVFFDVAYQSYLPALVSREDLIEGNSKLEVSRSVAQIAGPGIAGALVQLVTAPIAIFLDALSFLVSVLSLLIINKPEPPPPPAHTRQSMWHEIGEGLGVVLRNPVLRSIAGCTATSNLFSQVMFAVYVLYATRELHVDPGLLGLIFSIGSIGALLGALIAGRAAQQFGLGTTLIISILLAGASAILVPLAGGSLFVVAAMLIASFFVASVASPVYNINQVSLRQAITPDRVQGRMNATMRFIVWGTIPIGSLLGGALGSAIGLRPTLFVGAIGSLLPFLWLVLSPVRSLRAQPAPFAEGAVEA
jgi:MFS family permease